jgi:hypothetical protein
MMGCCEPVFEKKNIVSVLNRFLQNLTHKGIPASGKVLLLCSKIMLPGKNAPLPEALLGLGSDAWDMDKCVFEQKKSLPLL